VEALLRKVMQTLKNTCFVFCGSNQRMMRELFNSAKRPFYGSTRNINLQKIDASIYASFIKKHFSKHKFKIADSNIELILELSDFHTYYTQRLCSELFAANIKHIKTEHIYQTLKKQ
jgi:predicted nuclease of restriction endonuclease-like RecB superfamily